MVSTGTSNRPLSEEIAAGLEQRRRRGALQRWREEVADYWFAYLLVLPSFLLIAALIAVAVFGVLRGSFDFVWLAVMGWFMSALAAGAYRQHVTRVRLGEVSVSSIMSTPAVVVPAELSLEQVGHSYFLAGRHPRYPVVQDGRVIGLIDIEHVNEVPRDRWTETTVGEVASRGLENAVASPYASVDSVLPRLEPGGPGAVLVVDGGRLAGIVTRSDVIRLIMDITRDRDQSAR